MGKNGRAKALYGGIDIGGTKLYAIISDESGSILGRAKKKAKPERGFDGVMERVAEVFAEACETSGVKPTDLDAVGLGSPSPILEDGTAVFAPNLGWENVPLGKTLAKLLNLPVFVENDCNAGTFGEYTFGAGKGSNSLVGLFMGTGLGGGIVYKGEVVRGENRYAAEVGHMIVQAGGRRCGCGHLGCLEAYASKTGMGKRFAHEIIFQGKDSILARKMKGDFSNVKSSVLAEGWFAGDEVVVETLKEAAYYLGVGAGSIVTLLGPDMIVIGGGVFEALGKELLGYVVKAAKESITPEASINDTKVVLAKLGDDAVALGAVAYAMQRVGQA